MHILYRFLLLAAAGIRIGRGVLAWLWVGSLLVTLVVALPWFELTVPGLWQWVAAFAFLFTLSGLGADYFAQRTRSLTWQRALAQLTHLSRVFLRRALKVLAVYYVVSFLLLFVVGWIAFMLLIFPTGLLLQKPSPEQVVFVRGSQQLVLRDGKMVVLRPLVPGLRFVTPLSPEELDSTWMAVTSPTPPLTYLASDLSRTQTNLLTTARKARLDAAQERRAQAQQAAALAAQQATEQNLGYDMLRFDLADNWYTPSHERTFRILRPPLDSTHYGYAKLNPAGTLHLTCDNLGTTSEILTLTIVHFKGLGTYQIAPYLAAEGEQSTLALRRYTAGLVTTFSSRPDEPAHVTITRFDPQQRVVEGTFAGQLRSPDGAQADLSAGEFRLRFKYLRSPSASPQ